jgi:hypothetical protein
MALNCNNAVEGALRTRVGSVCPGGTGGSAFAFAEANGYGGTRRMKFEG